MSKAEDIKKLRSISGAGMMDCKKALNDNNNDIEKSIEYLRKKGLVKATKRMGRETAVGRVFSYIHGPGNIGVILQVNCETDFVARNEDFGNLGNELSMQIAATAPVAITQEDLEQSMVEKERQFYENEAEKNNKGAHKVAYVEGKLKKFYSENCLLEQSYIKDDKVLIKDFIKQYISKFGENITIARFERYQVQ